MSLLFPEPSRCDLNFMLRGIPVRVTPWFSLAQGALGMIFLIPYLIIATLDDPDAGPLGVMIFAVWIICAFVSILVHELGHVLVGRCFGSEGAIILTALGGLAPGSPDLPSRSPRIAVYLPGPAAH